MTTVLILTLRANTFFSRFLCLFYLQKDP